MAEVKPGAVAVPVDEEEEANMISMFTDQDKKLMTFEYFLETSKIILEANFLNQKNELAQGINARRKLLAEASGKKENKTSKKENVADLKAKLNKWEDMEKSYERHKEIKSEIKRLEEKQKKKASAGDKPPVDPAEIKIKI